MKAAAAKWGTMTDAEKAKYKSVRQYEKFFEQSNCVVHPSQFKA